MKSYFIHLIFLSFFAYEQYKIVPEKDIISKMNTRPLTYLALGDSYTIGEGVPEKDRYPNQLVAKLNTETNQEWTNAEIIAKTGWTVDELDEGINNSTLIHNSYDLVTLLIGVNNQYRGRAVEVYKAEFEQMLLRAIVFAGNLPKHVVVLSIPDWGITPFANEKRSDRKKIASEIDAYNLAQKNVCDQYGVFFIDITEDYRATGNQPEMYVEDNLHPSGKVYARWTQKLFEHVTKMNSNS